MRAFVARLNPSHLLSYATLPTSFAVEFVPWTLGQIRYLDKWQTARTMAKTMAIPCLSPRPGIAFLLQLLQNLLRLHNTVGTVIPGISYFIF